MESYAFKLKFLLESSGDQVDKNGLKVPALLEIQNDPKYLLGILNSIDTAHDPYKSRRRTILRLFSSISSIARDWAKKTKGDPYAGEDSFYIEAEVSISPEGMEFLKEFVDKPPEGVKYSSIPVQHLLVSIEDQYDEWRRSENGKTGISNVPSPSL